MFDTNAENALKQTLLYVEGAYATNTIRAYRSDMTEFIVFCRSCNLEPLPASPQAVAQFLNLVIDAGIKSASIRRKVSAISAIHRWNDIADPTKHLDVKIAVRKMHRKLGRNSAQAYGVTAPILDKLMRAAGDSLRGTRDKALLLLAHDTLRRRSELVSLRIEDIESLSDGGATVHLRRSKTDPEGSGKYLRISKNTYLALQTWFNKANICDGYILRGVKNEHHITSSLYEGQISRIFKRLAGAAGLNEQIVQRISGHSLRVGGAQDLLKNGSSLPQIMVAGGWTKTDTVMRYVERAL